MPFEIVPVLDLKSGRVVHARAGERDKYAPVRSALTDSSDPQAVLDSLLALSPFRCVYIADLDAIEGRGDHRPVVAALVSQYPGIDVWIDGGFTNLDAAASAAGAGATPVLGTESWSHGEALAAAIRHLGPDGCVLSLDYRGDRFVGPVAFDARPELWPDRLIAMTLSRVGTGSGPDFARLEAIGHQAGTRRLYAAGGVRGADDLRALAGQRIAGVLVATALHDGRLTRAALAEITAA